MTDPVTCPHCREHLDIPAEYRGRAVRCATCQNVFTVPAGSPPAGPAAGPPGDDPDSPAPPRRRDVDDRPRGGRGASPPAARPSNAGVWVLLLVTLLLVGGCVGGCVGLAAWAYNPTMHPFDSPEGKFRVEFPGDPSPTVSGENGRVTVFADREGQERYAVKCYEVPIRLRFLPEAEALDELAKAELKDLGTPTRREVTTHGGLPALDLMAETGSGLFTRRVTVMRLVLVGNRVYVVSAVGGPNFDQQLPWWVRQFFTSFELTDPAVRAKGKKAEKADGGPNPFNRGVKQGEPDEGK